jgi:hypothetical protein
VIISASRRTDIPAFYADWFRNRLRAGFCLVPNPFNPAQVARVSMRREDVDAIVFWTRNPTPLLPVLDELDDQGFPYIFLFTLTGYGPPLEPSSPPLRQAIDGFTRLAGRIGPARVVWRYDPIVLGPQLTVDDHIARFQNLAGDLEGVTETVKISFVDLYYKTRRRLGRLAGGSEYLTDPVSNPELPRLLSALKETVSAHGMSLETCAEEHDLTALGAPPGRCIDGLLLSRLFAGSFPVTKDPGQRRHCRCAPSRDIGMNGSCLHGCVYCYATRSHQAAVSNHAHHDPEAPSLLPLRKPKDQ